MPQQPRRLNPDASPLARFGACLREHRTRRGWVQAELGRAVHVSGTLIAKLEKAERRPQPDVARRLDEVLDAGGELTRLAAAAMTTPIPRPGPAIGTAALPPGVKAGEQFGVRFGVRDLRRLADRYDVPEDGAVRPLAELERIVGQVIRWRLDSDYERLAAVLPLLLPELTRAMLDGNGRHQEEAASLLAQGWRAADAIASKLGLFDLSARLIHVMGWAASGAGDDGLSLAATSYVRAETFLTSGELRAGHRMLECAAARISPAASAHAKAQYGALHMRAALTAGRAGMDAQAEADLGEARAMAAQIPEGIWEGTAFGPASVRIHEVSTQVDLDRPQRALATARGWMPPSSLPAERRSHFFVDLARAQLAVGRYEEVFSSLTRAYDIAPQNVRVHPHVLQTLTGLAHTSPGNAAAASRFAERAAIPVRLRKVRARQPRR